jgi:plasmid maintenance system killer protein
VRLEFRQQAFEDLQYWVQTNLSGWWSKRIDQEHRLIYRVENDSLIIAQARGHYV